MVVRNNEIRTRTMQTGYLSTLLASQYLSLSQSTCVGHIKLHRGVKFNYSNSKIITYNAEYNENSPKKYFSVLKKTWNSCPIYRAYFLKLLRN